MINDGKASEGAFPSFSATKALVFFCILINTLYQVFARDMAFPIPPTFNAAKSSVVNFRTSSGVAPSKIQTKHPQNPRVTSESLSAQNLTLPVSSILASTHTCAVHPITRFLAVRLDSANGGSTFV
uniref:Uncharacterized protein n=1 Tax=Opuntia streptacantha TaxID=393608 RepID=A0A7C9EFC1_OPUST